jgi:GNAT superfamily N-acetyltransferase
MADSNHSHHEVPSLDVRGYTLIDYPSVKALYEEAGVFDPETDAEDRLLAKVEENPDGLLVTTDEDGTVLGTVSIVDDGRIAILFRLVVKPGEHAHMIRMRLLNDAETILKEYGYNEVHIIAPEEDKPIQDEYAHYGFTKGKPYRWFWKKITSGN